MQHLDELRSRLVRCIIYVTIAGIVAWIWFYDPLFKGLTVPLREAAVQYGLKVDFGFIHFTEPFFLKLKVSTFLALAFASPLILLEAWGFISPGLLPEERRPFRIVFPMSVALFFMGAGLSYIVLPAAFVWFLSFLPRDVQLLQRVPDYILFVVKMCGAFGLAFQMPVLLMFAGKIGLIQASTMKRYWRQAVVFIILIAAILTPSQDPLSMLMMAVPMAFLYLFSITLVKWVQPKFETVPYGDDDEEETVARPTINPDEED